MVTHSTPTELPRGNKPPWVLSALVLAGTGVELFRFLHLALGWKFWIGWMPALSFWLRLNIPFLLALLGLLVLISLFTRQNWSSRAGRSYLLLLLLMEGMVAVITVSEPFSPASIPGWILRGTAILALAAWIYLDYRKGKSG